MPTIKLHHPITADGATVKTITMRRPKVRDLRDAQAMEKNATEADVEIRLFANLCEIAPTTIEELDIADYTQLQQAYQDFLSQPGAK